MRRSTGAIAHPLLCNRHHVFPHGESPIPDFGENVFRDSGTPFTRHHLYWTAELLSQPRLHRREVCRNPLQCVSEVTGRTGDGAAVKDMDEHRMHLGLSAGPRVADNASMKSFFSAKIPKQKLHPSPHGTPDCSGIIRRPGVQPLPLLEPTVVPPPWPYGCCRHRPGGRYCCRHAGRRRFGALHLDCRVALTGIAAPQKRRQIVIWQAAQ